MVVENRKYLQKLTDVLNARAPLAIAYSGGLDSRFLCHIASQAGIDFLALTVTGPHIPARESKEAIVSAQRGGLRLWEVPLDILTLPGINSNSRLRCYFCKKAVFKELSSLLTRNKENRTLCDGTNADDRGEYRPGRKALLEEGVFSPLEELGIGKQVIRSLAEETGMDRPWQKASPCLLTRLAYGMSPTKEQLLRVDSAEEALELVLAKDNPDSSHPPLFRLRLTPSPLLSVTRPLVNTEAVCNILASFDLLPCRVEITEHVSGFFDRPLPILENFPLLTN